MTTTVLNSVPTPLAASRRFGSCLPPKSKSKFTGNPPASNLPSAPSTVQAASSPVRSSRSSLWSWTPCLQIDSGTKTLPLQIFPSATQFADNLQVAVVRALAETDEHDLLNRWMALQKPARFSHRNPCRAFQR